MRSSQAEGQQGIYLLVSKHKNAIVSCGTPYSHLPGRRRTKPWHYELEGVARPHKRTWHVYGEVLCRCIEVGVTTAHAHEVGRKPQLRFPTTCTDFVDMCTRGSRMAGTAGAVHEISFERHTSNDTKYGVVVL